MCIILCIRYIDFLSLVPLIHSIISRVQFTELSKHLRQNIKAYNTYIMYGNISNVFYRLSVWEVGGNWEVIK